MSQTQSQAANGSVASAFSRTRRIAKCSLLCAMLVVSCFFTIPLGPVPFTLQTAVVILIALLCSSGEAAVATGAYLLMGAIGLPVFAGMTGGIIRSSSGFLFSYLIGTTLVSALRVFLEGKGFGQGAKRFALSVFCAICIMVISDALGWLWLMFFTGMDPLAAFLAADAPFIVIDCCKAALSIVVASAVRKALPGL